MKKIYALIVLLFLVNISLSAQSGAELDNSKGTSMMPIINGMESIVKAVEESAVEIVQLVELSLGSA